MTTVARRAATFGVALLTALALLVGTGPAGAAPKRAPAKAKLTYESSIRVKLTSARPACFQQRRVFVVYDTGAGGQFEGLVGRTDDRGVIDTWPTSARSRAMYRLTALSPRSKRCLPTQSNTVRFEVTAKQAAPSPVKATLSYDGSRITVKLRSRRAACERNRTVALVVLNNGAGVIGKTNRRGVFRYPVDEVGPDRLRVSTFALRTGRCKLGQSNTLVLEPDVGGPL